MTLRLKTNPRSCRSEGFILPSVVLALTLLLIIVPMLILFIQKDSKDAQSLGKKNNSFQLAEAGQDRGAWKLRESDTVWTNAISSTTITGYNNDITYSDVAGGQYKILFAAGPAPGQVTVISKGLATGTNDVRAIEGVYSKGTIAGAMSVVGGLNWKDNLTVHWGPIVEYGSITAVPPTRYPRKYCAGSIKDSASGYDDSASAPNGAMPSGDWAAYDYASYYDLGNAPSIKLNDYRTLARNTCLTELDATTGPGAAAHELGPTGCHSGYYTADVNIIPNAGGNFILTCSTCVIFTEGAVKSFPNNAWLDIRALLAIGDVDFNAKNTTYIATVPANAQDEYQYDPLGNLAAGTATKYWNDSGWVNGANFTLSNVGMHGFIYCGGDVKNAGGNTILVGALFVAGSLTVNTTTIYYDSVVAENILYENATISRVSWDETRTTW